MHLITSQDVLEMLLAPIQMSIYDLLPQEVFWLNPPLVPYLEVFQAGPIMRR